CCCRGSTDALDSAQTQNICSFAVAANRGKYFVQTVSRSPSSSLFFEDLSPSSALFTVRIVLCSHTSLSPVCVCTLINSSHLEDEDEKEKEKMSNRIGRWRWQL